MNDDELDFEIRNALRAEATDEQLARLEGFWRQQSRAEARRRLVRRVTATAAALAVVGAAWLARDGRQGVTEPRGDLAAQAPTMTVDPVESAAAVELPASGRAATPYERLVFAIRTSGGVPPEQAALAQLRRARTVDERRRLAIRLGDVGTLGSVTALADLAAEPAVREEALAAIVRIVGVDQLGGVVRRIDEPSVRAALAGQLLAAESAGALGEFLALAVEPATRNAALAAAEAANPLPVSALVSWLDAENKRARLGAALVLGRVNGPEVTEALIARVSGGGRAPVEAWVALLACRGEEVDRFLASIARQPRMLGQVNNARAYWARMIP